MNFNKKNRIHLVFFFKLTQYYLCSCGLEHNTFIVHKYIDVRVDGVYGDDRVGLRGL